MPLSRREFIASSVAAASLYGAGKLTPKADSIIYIWLPGGMAQTDTWDPKKFTPYVAGMKGSEVLGTCDPIPTSADGIFLGAGLDNMARVMNRGAILRTLSSETKFGAIHLKAQYYAKTGYLFPSGVKTPSLGAVVSARSDGEIRRCPLTFISGATSTPATRKSCSSANTSAPAFTASIMRRS